MENKVKIFLEKWNSLSKLIDKEIEKTFEVNEKTGEVKRDWGEVKEVDNVLKKMGVILLKKRQKLGGGRIYDWKVNEEVFEENEIKEGEFGRLVYEVYGKANRWLGNESDRIFKFVFDLKDNVIEKIEVWEENPAGKEIKSLWPVVWDSEEIEGGLLKKREVLLSCNVIEIKRVLKKWYKEFVFKSEGVIKFWKKWNKVFIKPGKYRASKSNFWLEIKEDNGEFFIERVKYINKIYVGFGLEKLFSEYFYDGEDVNLLRESYWKIKDALKYDKFNAERVINKVVEDYYNVKIIDGVINYE